MSLDRAAIERVVPQRGTMCLLGRVIAWDSTHISCTAPAPDPAHPLARNRVVPAIAAIEYAAQATAVHGALIEPVDAEHADHARAAPQAGMLATLADVQLLTACMPQDAGPVNVQARRLGHSSQGCLYLFEVACGNRQIASGRLMVAFTLPPAQ